MEPFLKNAAGDYNKKLLANFIDIKEFGQGDRRI